MSNTIIYKTNSFSVKVPNVPHITQKEGGHIFIEVNDQNISDRWELSCEEAFELMWLSQVVGLAFKETMEYFGVKLYKLNFQDNGNWSFIRGDKPVLHIHIYGRAECEKDNKTSNQTYGNALVFPYVDTGFYDNFEPLSEEQIKYLSNKISEISKEPRFAPYAPNCIERA